MALTKIVRSEKAPRTGEYASNPERKTSPCTSDLAGVDFFLKKERTFFFGVTDVLASAWGFLRIICFENRFELGTINTPIQNSTAFSKPEGGTREARPTDFPPIFPNEFRIFGALARTDFSPRRRFEIRSNFDS